MKNYWLTLHKDTFLWVKGDEGCVFNTLNQKSLRFSNIEVIDQITSELLKIGNLYRTVLSESQLEDVVVKKWLDSLVSMESAIITPVDDNHRCTASMMPELKIQNTLNYYKFCHEKRVDDCIMTNLHKLIIHVNASKYGNKNFSDQTIYPIKEPNEHIDIESLQALLLSSGYPNFLSEISLVGCLWEYPDCSSLFSFLKGIKIPITVYCTEKDYLNNLKEAEKVAKDVMSFFVLVSDYSSLEKNTILPFSKGGNIFVKFIVTSENDCEIAEALIEKHDLPGSSILPVYTGQNLLFFENYVYTTQEDIDSISLSKREIFAHQALNTHFFGTLTIFPDGSVYSDTTQDSIGTINESLYAMVYREMIEGNTWLRTREYSPCNACIYQYLCPSPTIYEKVIGRANLCHIKKPVNLL